MVMGHVWINQMGSWDFNGDFHGICKPILMGLSLILMDVMVILMGCYGDFDGILNSDF